MEILAGRVDDIDYIITWNDNVEQLPYYYTGRRGVSVSTNAREVREPCKQGDFYPHCRALIIYRCDILPFFRILFALFNRFCQNGPGPERTVFFGPYPFKPVLQLFLPIPRRRLLRPVQQTFSSLQMVRSPVGPQTHLIADSCESFDFLVHCQVFLGDVPVFYPRDQDKA